jgi:uncharacterized protein (DUF433 family)
MTEKITWTTTEQPAPVVRTFRLLVLMHSATTRDATPADLANLPDEVLAEAGLYRRYPAVTDPFAETVISTAELESLRARLAEANRERAACVPVRDVASALGVLEDIDVGREILEAAQSVRSDANRWLDEAIALRARLAEVEAERDSAHEQYTGYALVKSIGDGNVSVMWDDHDHHFAPMSRLRDAQSDLAQAREELARITHTLQLHQLDKEYECESVSEHIACVLDDYTKASEELVALREAVDKARAYVHAAQADASHGGRASGIKSMRGDEPRVAFDELDEALSKLSARPGTEAEATAGDAPSGQRTLRERLRHQCDIVEYGAIEHRQDTSAILREAAAQLDAQAARIRELEAVDRANGIAGRDDALTIERLHERIRELERDVAPPAAPSDWRETAGIPRRNCLDRLTPAELAIRAAIDAVEMVGADVLLTQTVVLLGQAADKLADYIDGTKPEPVYDVGQERDAAPPAAPSEPSSQLLVVCQPGRVGGKPTIGESRLTVGAVASLIRAGYSDERVAREYESSKLTAHDVSVVRALLDELRENPADAASVNARTGAEVAAEVLAKFPRCEHCTAPARMRERMGSGQRLCAEHERRAVVMTDPVPWLEALEAAERLCVAASPAPPPSEQGGEWTVCRPCRGTGVITGQSASADAGEG